MPSGVHELARAVGDARRVDLARNARELPEPGEQRVPVVEGGADRADAAQQLHLVAGQPALEHSAVGEHAAHVVGAQLVADERFGSLLDPQQRVVREMALVEQQHEDPSRLGRCHGRAGGHLGPGAQRVRDEIELLDGLAPAVLEDLEVLSPDVGGEPIVPIDDDGVDFDQRGARLEGRRLRRALRRLAADAPFAAMQRDSDGAAAGEPQKVPHDVLFDSRILSVSSAAFRRIRPCHILRLPIFAAWRQTP